MQESPASVWLLPETGRVNDLTRNPAHGEGAVHRRLKQAVERWIESSLTGVAATEVRCPIARFRFDVAGVVSVDSEKARPLWDWSLRGESSRLSPSQTLVIECKASRNDFLRDRFERRNVEAAQRCILAESESLKLALQQSEEAPSYVLQPDLFGDSSQIDLRRCNWPSARRLERARDRLRCALESGTKFERVARYALADGLLIAAPEGLLSPNELPEGWGLIEFNLSILVASENRETPEPRLVRSSRLTRPSSRKFRFRLTRNIERTRSRRRGQPWPDPEPYLWAAADWQTFASASNA